MALIRKLVAIGNVRSTEGILHCDVIVLPLLWWTCISVVIGRGACSAAAANQEGKYGAACIVAPTKMPAPSSRKN
jgi:hypothetical protein